jgi:hypothetical protein
VSTRSGRLPVKEYSKRLCPCSPCVQQRVKLHNRSTSQPLNANKDSNSHWTLPYPNTLAFLTRWFTDPCVEPAPPFISHTQTRASTTMHSASTRSDADAICVCVVLAHHSYLVALLACTSSGSTNAPQQLLLFMPSCRFLSLSGVLGRSINACRACSRP